MSDDQNSSPHGNEEKGEPINIQAHDSMQIVDSPGVQLRQIREYLKKSLLLIILLICLNVFSGVMSSWPLIDCWPREGWPSFLISLAINGIGGWVGFKALMKVREIRISRNQRG